MKRSMQEGAERSSVPEYKLFSYAEQDAAISYICRYTRAGRRAGRGYNFTYNDVIFTADTETSKLVPDQYDAAGNYIPHENIVVAWTVSAVCPDGDICTVYGSRPSEFCYFLALLQEALPGERTFFWLHNLSYDWTFLELFLFQVFDKPVKQLNTKAHYPISIEFSNGITLRDSYIISQQGLERWADELQVEHRKAAGKWDYDRFRDQSGHFTHDELQYIEQDTLALAECLEKLRRQLNKHVYSMPYTCTGILREETRKIGRKNRARDQFIRKAPCYELYKKLVLAYHGGYTHNNRHAAGWVWPDNYDWPACYDFASSYPFRMLVDLYPCERFRKNEGIMNADDILKFSDTTAFIFTLYAEGVRLKDPDDPMPALQLSKCIMNANAITDNGRILECAACEICLNEVDLGVIREQYVFDRHVCRDIWSAAKAPLPRWFRDFVYKCFEDKTMKKGGDPVDYSLAKARLNSL